MWRITSAIAGWQMNMTREKSSSEGCQNMKSSDIRQTFLDFYVYRNHVMLPGSSLVPANDPTLLFTNAGKKKCCDKTKNAFK